MKHAYLIMAHNEFRVLAELIECLDDERNDIYMHFDRKVKQCPTLATTKASLFVLSNRVDVRWGNVSQIECEYVLFEAAHKHGGYSRYIVLSGVHMPLQSQDYIHQWFDARSQQEILSPVPNNHFQEDLKMHRYNLFTRWYAHSIWIQRAWGAAIALQRKWNIRRHTDRNYDISANWVCLTPRAVQCLLEHRADVMREWRYTFCGDEFFVRSILQRYGFAKQIVLTDEVLLVTFTNPSSPHTFCSADYDLLKTSDHLFARKFSETNMAIIKRIKEKTKVSMSHP